jgi:hypothetical protein
MLSLACTEDLSCKRLRGNQVELPDAVKQTGADFLPIIYPR